MIPKILRFTDGPCAYNWWCYVPDHVISAHTRDRKYRKLKTAKNVNLRWGQISWRRFLLPDEIIKTLSFYRVRSSESFSDTVLHIDSEFASKLISSGADNTFIFWKSYTGDKFSAKLYSLLQTCRGTIISKETTRKTYIL